MKLVLADGTTFPGVAFGAARAVAGEVVFTTGMTGYPEMLTDPAYQGQILVQSYPLQGNYGVGTGPFESDRIQVAGLVVGQLAARPSHHAAVRTLEQWLASEGVPGLAGIDTRALVCHLRERGAMRGMLLPDEPAPGLPVSEIDLSAVEALAIGAVRIYPAGPLRVLAIDPGMRESAIQALVRRGVTVLRYPAGADWETVLDQVHGVVIGSGPGDPAAWRTLVPRVARLLERGLPVLGLCLGHQLLALAAGGRTVKLRHGHRSLNQPVRDLRTGRAYSTAQNHGYAVEADSLPAGWESWCVNLHDGSVEGIRHRERPYVGVQFHPEASPGPRDTAFLFDEFVSRLRPPPATATSPASGGGEVLLPLPLAGEVAARPEGASTPPHRVLLLGAGPVQIGQAGEFDYAGTQAVKALREAGVHVTVLNPNVASVQTSEGLADAVHLLPVTPEFATRVIEAERCDALLVGFGGQTALACGLALEADGTLARLGVRLLGTPAEAIRRAEDRDLFREAVEGLGLPVPRGLAARTVEEARAAGRALGLPVIVRAGYALGGKGAAIAHTEADLVAAAAHALAGAPQVLVEASLVGWKEIELEVLRDAADNVLAVCALEGLDPMGIHTGDSIVVAPVQTLTDGELQDLRDAAFRLVRHLGLVGECNVQFAVDPSSGAFRVIELNPRLSRSSALASKATGYPLAYLAAKLALGEALPDLVNPATGRTAFLEPAMDHVVVKVPRWDFNRCAGADPRLGPEMTSVGEVMAAGRTLAEALQKALRMTEIGADGFDPALAGELDPPTPSRVFALARALERGDDPLRLAHQTGIDRYFVGELARIAEMRRLLVGGEPAPGVAARARLLAAKRLGFSDAMLATAWGLPEAEVRARRERAGVVPGLAPIDSLAGEHPTRASGWYTTYGATAGRPETIPSGAVLVLGAGGFRIGSSLEFDWACVGALAAARELGHATLMLNCNPETVSTDTDAADHLVLEELTLEAVLGLMHELAPAGVIASMGGQTPNTLAGALAAAGVPLLGTPAAAIDRAEDRAAFSALCQALGLAQPAWAAVASCAPADLAEAVARVGGFPVVVRPSYVLSGVAMQVARDPAALAAAVQAALPVAAGRPIVLSHFEAGARELEFEAVAHAGSVVLAAVCEHVEDAGVHTGDATLLLPPQDVGPDVVAEVHRIGARLAEALDITGPFNLQLLVCNDRVQVLECNLRASRGLPFVSRALGVDFARAAARLQLGGAATSPVPSRPQPGIAAKAPRFSFRRLRGVDPLPGLSMGATGEAAAIAPDADTALLLALMGAGLVAPAHGVLFVPDDTPEWREAGQAIALLLEDIGLALYAPDDTAASVHACRAIGLGEAAVQAARAAMAAGRIDLVVCAPVPRSLPGCAGPRLRRAAVDHEVPLLTDARLALRVMRAIGRHAGRILA